MSIDISHKCFDMLHISEESYVFVYYICFWSWSYDDSINYVKVTRPDSSKINVKDIR